MPQSSSMRGTGAPPEASLSARYSEHLFTFNGERYRLIDKNTKHPVHFDHTAQDNDQRIEAVKAIAEEIFQRGTDFPPKNTQTLTRECAYTRGEENPVDYSGKTSLKKNQYNTLQIRVFKFTNVLPSSNNLNTDNEKSVYLEQQNDENRDLEVVADVSPQKVTVTHKVAMAAIFNILEKLDFSKSDASSKETFNLQGQGQVHLVNTDPSIKETTVVKGIAQVHSKDASGEGSSGNRPTPPSETTPTTPSTPSENGGDSNEATSSSGSPKTPTIIERKEEVSKESEDPKPIEYTSFNPLPEQDELNTKSKSWLPNSWLFGKANTAPVIVPPEKPQANNAEKSKELLAEISQKETLLKEALEEKNSKAYKEALRLTRQKVGGITAIKKFPQHLEILTAEQRHFPNYVAYVKKNYIAYVKKNGRPKDPEFLDDRPKDPEFLQAWLDNIQTYLPTEQA